MTAPRPATRCTRRACGAPYSQHVGPELACPDGSGKTWRGRESRRAGQSFTEREVVVLDEICRRLLAGGLRGDDAIDFTRLHARELGGLERKAGAMRVKVGTKA